jgi:hypothetical protein
MELNMMQKRHCIEEGQNQMKLVTLKVDFCVEIETHSFHSFGVETSYATGEQKGSITAWPFHALLQSRAYITVMDAGDSMALLCYVSQ